MRQTEDKQSEVCIEFCLGSKALGFMSVRICRKSRSLEKKNGEKKRGMQACEWGTKGLDDR